MSEPVRTSYFTNPVYYLPRHIVLELIDKKVKEETDRANASKIYPNRHDHKKECLLELRNEIEKL